MDIPRAMGNRDSDDSEFKVVFALSIHPGLVRLGRTTTTFYL
jgi:hypothetical protein